ncbi:MAG: hypothetical protein GF393_00525 [Armatimonadia bacterium]|nr:hypothetical protein [Armatimonadia bacterium]
MRSIGLLATVVIIVGALLAGCGGSDTQTAPATQGDWAYLHQQAPGDAPTIRLNLQDPSVPLDDQIFAWRFYRSAGQRYFSLTAANLVDAIFESRLPGGLWDDSPQASGLVEVDREFQWITPGGEQDTGSIDLEYSHPALNAGVTYYHRVQRVIEPPSRAGSGAPIAQQVGTSQVPLISIDPSNALSQGSQPTAGVTYLTPPVLQTPSNGAFNQSTVSITFTWSTTVGANEYVLQVFPADDPNGQRNPRYQITLRQDFGGTMNHTFTDNFEPGARFYWRVGARRAGEAQPVNELLLQRGWLHSSMRTFTTAQAPPPPPSN